MKPKTEVCIPTIGFKEHAYSWKRTDLGKDTGQNENTVIQYIQIYDHARITVLSNASWMFSANPGCNLD